MRARRGKRNDSGKFEGAIVEQLQRRLGEPGFRNSGADRSVIFPDTVAMQVARTRNGLRFSQHGVVISELRTTPGATHSVFDVLAALMVLLRPAGQVGMLGFAGGGMMAPLRALGWSRPLTAVDLDQASYDLFRAHCPGWVNSVRWQRVEALQWLRRQKPDFDLLVDDLSIPQNGDVVKPEICWRELPGLLRQKLNGDGIGIFNLVSPPKEGWCAGIGKIAGHFRVTRIIQLDDFENRLVIGGTELPAARALGQGLRRLLRQIHSRQSDRLRVRSL